MKIKNDLTTIKNFVDFLKKRSITWLKVTSFFALVILVSTTLPTLSGIADLETSYNSVFTASTLDIGLRSDQADFGPISNSLWPGDVVSRDIYVQKLGSLNVKYLSRVSILPGSDTALCDALQLQVHYNWHTAAPATPGDLTNVQSDLKYSGSLSAFNDFVTNNPTHDPDMVIINSHTYYPNSFYGADEHWFSYEVSLPVDADTSLENMTCNFNMVTEAWQTNFESYDQGFSDTELIAGSLSTSVWTPATPTNDGWNIPPSSTTPDERPLDLACGATTNTGNTSAPRVAHNWSAVSGRNIAYQREVTYPSGSIGYFYATDNYTLFSSFGSGSGVQGLWNTRVRAFEDNNHDGNFDAGVDWPGAWSDYCEITLDTLAPAAAINSPSDGDSYAANATIDFYVTLSDANPASWLLTARDASNNAVPSFPDQTGGANTYNNETIYSWDTTGVPDGEYTISFSAVDEAGNASVVTSPTSQVIVTIDSTSGSTITVTNSPEKDIQNKVYNGDFSKGLESWGTQGQVAAVENGQAGVKPRSATFMAVLDGSGQGVNSISQNIDNSGRGLRSVGFWFNMVTSEVDPGFDEPALSAYINDKLVYQVWAKDLSRLQALSGASGQASGWQYVSIYVADDASSQLNLKLQAGNTGDQSQNTLVYLDDVNTAATVVDSGALFTIYSDNPDTIGEVAYRYLLDGQIKTGSLKSGVGFTLEGEPDDHMLYFWSVASTGAKGKMNSIYVTWDDQAPSSINDLKAYDEGEGEYSLTFTAPSDNFAPSVLRYEIRYSEQPITQDNWSAASRVSAVSNLTLGSEGLAPRVAGEQEDLLVKGLEAGKAYYFALKSMDSAHKWSELSNLALVEGQTMPAISPTPVPATDPLVVLQQQEPFKAWMSIKNASSFERGLYHIEYEHPVVDADNQVKVVDVINGGVDIDSDSVEVKDIYFGTCSGGECTPHRGIDATSIKLQLRLQDKDNAEKLLETGLTGGWND
ncbi:MAG: hypothetical protein ACOZAN_00385 [Patescibacteria group bacterium]